MRVIAGKYRSRPLSSMRGLDVRPTSDRLRETLFNVLTAGNPAALEGSVWIDLYAGTGAVGIEAISRGAAMVYFVESVADAAGVIKENLESLRIGSGFEILKQSAGQAVKGLGARAVSADVVFLDPPYRMEKAYAESLEALSAAAAVVKPGGSVIAEHHKKFELEEAFGRLRRYRKLVQGDAVLSFYRIES